MNEPTPALTPLAFAIRGDIVGEHRCPACRETVPQVYRPGRARIYCSHACRQRAYRWRRAHGVRLCVERTGPGQQAFNARRHAIRDQRDPASDVRDPRQRELTVCGAFARPMRENRGTHHQFIPESESSCRTCVDLVGAGPWGSGIPSVVRMYWPAEDRKRMAPPWSPPPDSIDCQAA